MKRPTANIERSAAQAAAVVNVAESAAKLGYFVFDPKERRTRFASNGLKHITERVYGGRDDVSINELFARVHKDDRKRVIASVLSTIDQNAPLDTEFRVICEDSDVLHLWMTNSIVNDPEEGVLRVGIVQDLTDRRERETALQENVALKRAIIDSALDGVVIIDHEGVICDFNPTAEQLFGFKKGEVVGKTLASTIVPEKYRDAHEAGMKRYLRDGDPHVIGQRIEIEAMNKSGDVFPIELAIKQINVGDRLLFTSNIRDISDRRAHEQKQAEHEAELKKAKDEAEAANKAKSEFLAAMSHEIRTPLNGVLGVLTLLGDTDLSDEQRHLLRTAYGSGQNLFTLISDILDLSKIEAGRMDQEFVDFHPLSVAQEATGLVEPVSTRKGLTVTIEAPPQLGAVHSEQAHIRQILTNLVSNAAKFTDDGSIKIRVSLRKSRLRYEVADTGIGIAKDHQSRLFKKFSQVDPTTRRKYGGTGLGLSICKELVQLLDGEIGFESAEGDGSLFWFEIPVIDAKSPVTESQSSVAQAPEKNINARILLAEDSYTNALVASSFLRSAGARVDIAANGLEVLSATSNGQYDLIIMDVSMPEMDGIEASEILRKKSGWTQSVPIIALTANASCTDQERCMDAGMSSFLTKPIERSKLLSNVYEIVSANAKTNGVTSNIAVKKPVSAGKIFDDNSIRESFGEMPSIFKSVISAFEIELQERLAAAEEAVKNGDLDAVARLGHALKSAAANVHAKNISVVSRTLEEIALTGDDGGVRETILQLKKLATKANAEISSLPFMDEAS